MSKSIQQVAIAGGGTAGWLAACVLAARRPDLGVTLVEAPDIATIGVGEGTWPTMRETLGQIGIAEDEFLAACDATFKQGSRFDGWVDGTDSYLHPFTPPPPGDPRELIAAWQASVPERPFAAAMTAQGAVCLRNLAPRQRAMPGYAGALNYGYHLDAGKFAALLARHATGRLGVRHIAARVGGVTEGADGLIAALALEGREPLAADFFIDCTGQAALLIGGHCGSRWIDRSDVSFNDRALAVQVAVAPDSAIASQTIGTAHAAGWLWDIGLTTRRGIGCVYSSRFMTDGQAGEVLAAYVAKAMPGAAMPSPRKIAFATGHRERFWHRNCLAVGLSAGFIEPLEASAIVLIELSLRALIDSFPQTTATLDLHAGRFNALFTYRWERIVEFLKLHYLPSRRSEPYWQAQRAPESIPQRLRDNLALWHERPPAAFDFPHVDELFPAASQQYVLYGMGFAPPTAAAAACASGMARLAAVQERARALTAALPPHRDYMTALGAVATSPADGALSQ